MNAQEIGTWLAGRFGGAILEMKADVREPWAVVDPGRLPEIAAALRDEPSLRFDYLRMVAGVDVPAENAIECVYLLFSLTHRHEFKIKVKLPRDNPRVRTVETVWPAANWHEREIFDLLGVEFEGHSDLRRILLPDDWIDHPLRKDYKEPEEYHGVSTRREYLTGMPELPTHPGKPAPAIK
jgi:NADH-quinone oxidoreductase subunit C